MAMQINPEDREIVLIEPEKPESKIKSFLRKLRIYSEVQRNAVRL
jgi:hypothetical protein